MLLSAGVGMPDGASEAIRSRPWSPSSWPCITLSASAGSWLMPASPNVPMVSVPPKTEW